MRVPWHRGAGKPAGQLNHLNVPTTEVFAVHLKQEVIVARTLEDHIGDGPTDVDDAWVAMSQEGVGSYAEVPLNPQR